MLFFVFVQFHANIQVEHVCEDWYLIAKGSTEVSSFKTVNLHKQRETRGRGTICQKQDQ